MELIGEKAKAIMEECKVRARAAGLLIHGDTLEYVVTNQDLILLNPKIGIPTLYDYWVDDVEVVKDKWLYDADPHNPYETVVNTRPAISYYNDNNPDWLNVMLFYHVLGHIDFFQNSIFFRWTWDDDFYGQALADKRLINRIREEMGPEKRWVDYVIEFARGINNLTGYYQELVEADAVQMQKIFGARSDRMTFYFGDFLRKLYDAGTVDLKFYYDEVERYNQHLETFGPDRAENIFFSDREFRSRFPEFAAVLKGREKKQAVLTRDIFQYLAENSPFINQGKNIWMKDVLQVVRRTALYFEAQFRSKIGNEGWASLWHERLFIKDDRIRGHEVDYAKVNAGVMLNPKIGLNPYIIGKYLWEYLEELAGKGKLSYAFQLMKDSQAREGFDQRLGPEYARKVLLEARVNFNDFLLINFFSDADFQDFMDRHNLFIAGVRPSREKMGFVEFYIKSRSAQEYRRMLNKFLYHPPHVLISTEKARDGELYLDHVFEGRQLVTKYIPAVLRGISFLYGGRVTLETTEFEIERDMNPHPRRDPEEEPRYRKVRIRYACEKKDVRRTILSRDDWEEATNG